MQFDYDAFKDIITIITPAITAIVAIIAVFQTRKQIKIKNKQFLFDRRFEKYIMVKGLIELFEENKTTIEYEEKEDSSIGVDLQFIWLTNNSYLKDITKIIKDTQNFENKVEFLLKIEEIKKNADEIKFLFRKHDSILLHNFVYAYAELILGMYKYQVFIDDMDKSRKENPLYKNKTYKELQEIFGERKHRKDYYEKIKSINDAYEEMLENKVIKNIEKQIKL